MGKSAEISEDLRKLMVADHKNGLGYSKIGEKYSRSKSTVQRVINNFKKNKGYKSASRTGRPRKTTARADIEIVREIKKLPTNSARSVKKSLQLDISERIIQRRLRKKGYSSHFKAKKPFISQKNKRARLEFAKKYINMPASFWERVIWSDESKFEFRNAKRRQRVWRKPQQKLNPKNVQSTIKFGGGSVLVWGCFSYHGVGNLVLVEGKMTGASYIDILSNNLQSSAQKMGLGHNFVYQQDNDPKHTSKVAKEYFEKESLELLEWPAQSPDLNPIEHLWSYIDEKLNRSLIGANKNGIFAQLRDAWEKIPDALIKNLVQSIPARLRAVMQAKGLNTKY